jgi:hypothetical protein
MATLVFTNVIPSTYDRSDVRGVFVCGTTADNEEYFWHSSPIDDPQGRIMWVSDVKQACGFSFNEGGKAATLAHVYKTSTFHHPELGD